MSSATYSEHWYRIADLHPRLRSHVKIDRHCYRGEIWYVLKDPISGRQHRLNEVGYAVVARLDGLLSVQEIWSFAVDSLGDAAPTQPEVLALLAQLHDGELIQSEATPDMADLFERGDKRRERDRAARLNPLALRVGLIDPTPMLDAFTPLAALFLRRWAAWAWLAVVSCALAMLAPQASTLMVYASQHLSTPRMLLVFWLTYPIVKAIHELAHALAVRVWGGEVREMGISLLMLMPVPFVDASAAAGFRQRQRRVLVSLMGILAETLLAALAALVWLHAADGTLREAAFAVMLIGGVSTLLFNGNPLMRFDAYYALSDAIESPGLAARSALYWRYLAKRHVMGLRQAVPPAVAPRERRWLIGYGAASGVYRIVVTLALVGWVVGQYAILGALAALWFLFSMLGRPAYKLLTYVKEAPELAGLRGRAATVSALAVIVPLGLLFALPIPDRTRADGVVWTPEQAQLRSEGEGFIQSVLVHDGQDVFAGDIILQLSDPTLDTDLERVTSRLRGLSVSYHNALFRQPAQAMSVDQEIRSAQAEKARIEGRIAALSVRAGVDGRVALTQAQDLMGVYVKRGALLGHVLAPDAASVRVVVPQAEVARVQQAGGSIQVRLADALATVMPARLRAQTPDASYNLPSAALGDRAGGPVVTDPADPEGLRTLEPLYTFDLVLPHSTLERVGARAWVRFDHGSRPLAQQWLYRLRQVFVGEFS